MTKKNENQLREAFLKIRDIEDLVFLLNETNLSSGSKKSNEFVLKIQHLKYYLHISKESYVTYYIPKKRKGERRKINAPVKGLKIILKKLNYFFQLVFTPKEAAHGFIPLRSIVTNARHHVSRKYVYNVDLVSFFPTIRFGRVRAIFKFAPFYFSDEISNLLANLCCHEGVLPQGAPTSPIISNIVCQRLDNKLARLAKRFKSRYTRYADDLTFSCNKNSFKIPAFKEELKKIIMDEGFKIHPDKIRLLSWKDRQIVTGLVVNRKLNVQKKFLTELKFFINYWKLTDEKKATIYFEKEYRKNGSSNKYNGAVPRMRDVLKGKLEFLKMVRGENDNTYQRLSEKFNNLTLKEKNKEKLQIETREKEKEKEKSVLIDNLKECFIVIDSESSPKKRDEICLTINELFYKLRKTYSVEDEELKLFRKEFDAILLIESNNNNKSILSYHRERYPQIEKSILYNNEIKKKLLEHNPRYVTSFLTKFQDSNSNFRNIVHSNKSVLFLSALKGARKELFENYPNKGLPQDLYDFIYSVLGVLIRTVEGENVKITSDQAFKRYNKTIIEFKRIYRFGSNSGETNLKESIFQIIDTISGFEDAFWRVEYPQQNFNIETFTNTNNVLNAIELILKGFKEKTNGKGILKFKIKKIRNTVYFDVIDVDSECSKNPDDIKGGDHGIIINYLNSLCDLEILTNYEGKAYKIQLLPVSSKNKSRVEDMVIEGFTYRFKFYNVPKVLLIDDDETRLEEQMDLLKDNYPKLYSFIRADKTLDSYSSLKDYNLLILHNSFKNFNGYEPLKKQAIENYKIHVVSFTGGVESFKNLEFESSIGAELMYQNLPRLLSEIKDNQDFDYKILNTGEAQKSSDNKKYKSEIFNLIRNEKLKFPELSPKVFELLLKMDIRKEDISFVKNTKQLGEIISHKI